MRDKRHSSSARRRSSRYRQRHKQVMLNRFIFAGILIIIVLLGTIMGVKKYRAGLEESTNDNKNKSQAVNSNGNENQTKDDNKSDENNVNENSAVNHKEDGKRIVCIDAGHGGKDCGAEGDGTGYEKDDNLKMAISLKAALEKRNITVYMTREDDVEVSFEDRVSMANDKMADLMVSVHRNEYGADTSVRGFETWVHSSMPSDSTDAAEKIQSALKATGYIKDRGVKFGSQSSSEEDLYINNHCVGPSVLLEMGFMSNSDDNYLFRNKTDELAEVVAAAILEWLDAQGL